MRQVVWQEGQIELCIISIAVIRKPCEQIIGPREVVYIEKRKGPSTDPCGTPLDLASCPSKNKLSTYFWIYSTV